MLYVTTRIGQDAFTSARALAENRGPEGGFYVPIHVPMFSAQQIEGLADRSFSQNAAEILNLLFATRLDGWAVEFAIGRYPVQMTSISSKILVAETWHNPTGKFERLVSGMEKAIRQSDQIREKPSNWLMIAARIAILFGIYGQLLEAGALTGDRKLDIAVPAGELSAVMAAWYARSWGLPIGTIVCCCNENNGLWNLLHKGELRTDVPALKTDTPACDTTVPQDLERLIYAALGPEETLRFLDCCRCGSTYCLSQEQMEILCGGLHVSVVGGKRVASTVPNLYKTTGILADPYTALAYSGLVDYRASSFENRMALILAEESPVFSLQFLAQCMNLSLSQIKQLLN